MFCIFLAARKFYRRLYPADEGFRIIHYKNKELHEVYIHDDVAEDERHNNSWYDNKAIKMDKTNGVVKIINNSYC